MKMCRKSYCIDFLAFIALIFINQRGLQAMRRGKIAASLITSTSETDWKVDSILRYVLRGEHVCLVCVIDGTGYNVRQIPNGQGGFGKVLVVTPHACHDKAHEDTEHLEIKTVRGEDVGFDLSSNNLIRLSDISKMKPIAVVTSALPVGKEGVVATWNNGAVTLEHFIITRNRNCPIIEEAGDQERMFCAEYFDSATRKMNVGEGATFFIKHDGAQLAAGIQVVYNEATGGNAFYYAKIAYDGFVREQ